MPMMTSAATTCAPSAEHHYYSGSGGSTTFLGSSGSSRYYNAIRNTMMMSSIEDGFGSCDFASMTQSHRALKVQDDGKNDDSHQTTEDATKKPSSSRPKMRKSKSSRSNGRRIRSCDFSGETEQQRLTPEEEALKQQLKEEKKRSKLRQKYELESLRETYTKLQDENEFLKNIIRQHIHPPDVANRIITESEESRAAYLDTTQGPTKAQQLLDVISKTTRQGSSKKLGSSLATTNEIPDDGSMNGYCDNITVVASGNCIRRKSINMQKDAEAEYKASIAAEEQKTLMLKRLTLEDAVMMTQDGNLRNSQKQICNNMA